MGVEQKVDDILARVARKPPLPVTKPLESKGRESQGVASRVTVSPLGVGGDLDFF
jgi:hypothetical protein